MGDAFTYDVFLSHSSRDKAVVPAFSLSNALIRGSLARSLYINGERARENG